MFLRSLEVRNYRSLENTKLSALSRFNVLIGRNNSGKSAVFGALEGLSRFLLPSELPAPDAGRLLSRLDATRRLEIELTFELKTDERRDFIDLVSLGGPDPSAPERLLASQFLRRVSYRFQAPPAAPNLLHLRETKLITEDGDWAVVQRMTGHERLDNPTSAFLAFRYAGETCPYTTLQASTLDIEQVVATHGPRMAPEYEIQSVPLNTRVSQDDGSTWLRERLAGYLRSAFFFDPFRFSEEVQSVSETYQLTQNGSNLAQVLNTLKTNDDDAYQKIEAFIYGALPDVGRLRAPTRGSQTQVDFRSPLGGYDTKLREMGGGVEQLLMVAVVLLTTTEESPVFLEEPESHLHAGAQRYLIEKLYEGDRQVFVTTHSPTFINQSRPKSLYRVTLTEGSTSVTEVQDQTELGTVLEDIGARNSDVLLSDAVLFVEGESDGDALAAWAETLNLGLAERNIQVLPMGGGEHVARGARPRTEVLVGISHAAPVPHVFVVDHDERSERDVERLQNNLGDNLHVLRRRELENYLLIPQAIRAAIASKHRVSAPAITSAVEETSEEDIEAIIVKAVEGLRGRVLLNRVRARIPGLKEGLMPREIVESLASEADSVDLHDTLRRTLRERVDEHFSEANIETLVSEERRALAKEWSEPEKRKELAPGAEVLEKVFGHFGSRYSKSKDGPRVAEHMMLEGIPEEIKDLLRKVVNLTVTA